jgi:hypothetical protein
VAKATVKKIGRKRRAAGWTLVALGVVVAGVWVWSGLGRVELPEFVMQRSSLDFHAQHGAVSVTRAVPANPREGQSRATPPAAPWSEWSVEALPLGVHRTSYGITAYTTYSAPLWPIPLLLWSSAAVLLRSGILARRRALSGACITCGYSLAGLEVGAPCPECGKGPGTT